MGVEDVGFVEGGGGDGAVEVGGFAAAFSAHQRRIASRPCSSRTELYQPGTGPTRGAFQTRPFEPRSLGWVRPRAFLASQCCRDWKE